VSWYLANSWLVILLSVLLGLAIGWALWRRPWHKRYHTESGAITRVTRDHSAVLADKDRALAAKDRALESSGAEVRRLQALLDAAPAAAAQGAAAADDDAEQGAGVVPAADAAAVTDDRGEVLADVDIPTGEIPTAESVDIAAVAAPSVDVDQQSAAEDADAVGGVGAAGPEQVEERPQPLAALSPVEEDDLERVEGIGPRIAAALRGAGITSFRRLADSDVAALQSALEAAGLRFAPSLPTWARQARLLADGDEEGFLRLTEQLVGGRDAGRRA
jgi:predicted flap endonuclease-1-like 5' DNA nuclease